MHDFLFISSDKDLQNLSMDALGHPGTHLGLTAIYLILSVSRGPLAAIFVLVFAHGVTESDS